MLHVSVYVKFKDAHIVVCIGTGTCTLVNAKTVQFIRGNECIVTKASPLYRILEVKLYT